MKKIKKIIIILVVAILLCISLSYVIYKALVNEYDLSISEKKWIDNNSSSVISLGVPNDLPVFGTVGKGVFFDFINYLEEKVGLNINENTYSYKSKLDGYHFEVTEEYEGDSLLLFSDHFVLISNNYDSIDDIEEIKKLNPGVLSDTSKLVSKYFKMGNSTFPEYEDFKTLLTDLGNGNLGYALVPLTEYKKEIIESKINIVSHLSDLMKYYYLRLGNEKVVNSILTKELSHWKTKYFLESYNKNNYSLFIETLKISEAEEDKLSSVTYKYGFAENKPYEVLSSSSYGGITAEYIQSFSKFANVEFTFKKYATATELAEAAINNKIDLYYNYYDYVTNFTDLGNLHPINYYVIAHNSDDLTLSNVNGLSNKNVYVLNNSYIYNYIKNIENIKVIPYSKSFELKKIIKKKNIIILDENTYEYYLNNVTNSYSVRLKGTIPNNYYSFRYKNDRDTFYKLFNAYIKTLDPQEIVRRGVTSYNNVVSKGKILGTIATYIIVILFIVGSIIFLYHRKSKRIKLNSKIKKEDKIKYIDLLTSLKNRNYFNDKVNIWNKNTIYPQACLVLDINNIKEINDTFGHVEGDLIIQSVSNALIKTQIDNTEIMRTDGNEFLVYFVGYSEKQVISYIKKLVKEFKKLPHDATVALGFSMIEDDKKLVEDAFNEASIKMRENKVSYENETKD